MRIQTKFKVGDNVWLGRTQAVISQIKIRVGLKFPRFNDNEVDIEYLISEKTQQFQSWVNEGLLTTVKSLKVSKRKETKK